MIAQNAIMLNLQRFNTGLRGIAILQSGNNAAAFIAQGPRFIEAAIKTGGNKAAIARQNGQAVIKRLIKTLAQAAQLSALLGKTGNLRRHFAAWFGHIVQKRRCQLRRRLQSLANGLRIARATALHGEAVQGARHIGRGFQSASHRIGQIRGGQKSGNGVQARLNFRALGQRRIKPQGQKPRPARRYRCVERVQQAARTSAR